MNYLNVYMFMAAMVLLLAIVMRGNLPQNKRYIVWACLLMFAVYGLRDAFSIGGDSSSSYLHLFQRMKDTAWAELRASADLNDNLGWYFFAKLGFILLGGNYQLFVTIISAFVLFSFGRFINRYSVNPVQSFVYYWGLWFYTFNFSALKQSIAMALVLLAFDAVLDRKLIKFLLIMALAMQFHFPSLIFLPAFFLVRLNPRRGFIVFVAAAFLAVYFWRDQILQFMIQFYYEDHIFIGEDRFLTGKVTVMLALVVVAYIFRTPSKGDPVYTASLQFVAIATVIQLFSVYNNVFERLADYYFQFSVIFVPFIFDTRIIRNRRSGQYAVASFAPYALGILCMMRFNDIVTREASRLMPYKFFFQ